MPATATPLAATAQTTGSEGSCGNSDDELVRSTEAEALALAAECETAVEVGDWRTIGSQSFAMPDGFVRTETYTTPQWTEDEAGAWVDIDPALEARPDGTIGTAATVSEISVSPGGEGPLVSVTAPEGGMFGLVWPEPLPEPTLDGTTATYASVFPDVDLRVDVGNERIGYVLVVHTPEAARSPELDRIELEVVTDGVDMVQDEQTGLLHAVDAQGTQLYSSEPALMWDSSEAGSEPPAATDSKAVDPLEGFGLDAAPESLPEQLAAATEDASSDPEPMPGRIEEMEVDLDGRTLAVLPDDAMLDDPDVEYPLYIDPTFTGSRTAYAKLHQQRPNGTSLWRDGSLAVGLQLWQSGSTYGLWRSAVRFGISSLHDRYIRDAKVRITQTHLAGCSPRYLRLWRVKAITASGTTWNNVRPLEGGYLQSKLVETSNKSTCGGSDQVITYGNDNVTNVVRKAVNNGNSQISFMFQSSNENPNNNGSQAWRTLSASSAKIIVDHRPKKSTNLKTDGSHCSTSGPGPWVSSTRPKLTAKAPEFNDGSGYLKFHLYTSDSGSNFYNWHVAANSGQTVTTTVPSGKLDEGETYRWRVLAKDSKSSSGSWQDMSRCWFRVNTPPREPTSPRVEGLACGTEASPTLITTRTPNLTAEPRDRDGGSVRLRVLFYEPTGSNIYNWYVDGRTTVRTGGRLPAGVVTSDGLYRWRANTHDGFEGGPYTPYCWMRIDTTAPEPPDVAQVTANPEPGQQVSFNLFGDSGVTRFRYAIQGQTVQTVDASDGTRQITVTPPSDSNDHVLQVWAVDEAGNESSRTDHWFTTGRTQEPDPAAFYRFDGDGLDDSGDGNDLASPAAPVYTTGHDGRPAGALEVDGTTDSCVSTEDRVLDTTESYTVAAWVRLDSDASSAMLIGQGAEIVSGFYLQYNLAWDAWMFALPDADDTVPDWAVAATAEPPAIGQWQHIAGVYDAPAERIRLYVDGELRDSTPVTFPTISAEGDLSVGCVVRTGGSVVFPLDGAVEDAAVYQQVLTGGQITDLMEGRDLPAATQAWYPLRGDGADYSGRSTPLTGIAEGAEWVPDHLGRPDSALQFNGDTCLTVPVPVDTAGAFSASAWVRPEPGAANSHTRVLSFNTDTYFTAALKHDVTDSGWTALLARGTDETAGLDGATLAGSAVPGEWTHVAMTVDRGTSTLTLYVNGEPVDTQALPAGAMSAGALSIGCAHGDGGKFTGAIADVRIWRGAVTAEAVAAMPTDLLAYWELDETLQGTDTQGGHDLTLDGAYDWVENRFNDCFASYGLGLDGTGYGSTASPVVTTDESFTVTAWVKLADLDGDHISVAQSGEVNSGFTLGYSIDRDRFEFAMASADTAETEWTRALAQEPPELDEVEGTSVWYHLVGQVDLGAGVIRLYVDGELQAEAPAVAAPWQADGPLTMGAALRDDQVTGHMVGMIDEVHAYSGVLDEDAIVRLSANRPWQPILPDGSCDGDDLPPGEW